MSALPRLGSAFLWASLCLSHVLGGFHLAPSLSTAHAKPRVTACSDKFVAKVREPATEKDRQIKVRCHLTLDPTDTITKKLIVEGASASGVRIQCRGALLAGARHNKQRRSLEIRSRRRGPIGGSIWKRPEDITVEDCRIEGELRVIGMTDGPRGRFTRSSSRRRGHTQRMRDAAPRRVRLRRLYIRTAGGIPLYISQGSTEVSLTDSVLAGTSDAVAIYMSAESAYNELRDNIIAVQTSRRELIAIDGSSDNLLVNNLLVPGQHGGIYIYRNCGERGTIRHNRPERNRIINNVFLYAPDQWDAPAIFVASRNGSPGYCHEDDGYPFGSSISDLDFARYNVLLQNRFTYRPVADAIQIGDPESDRPNTIVANETVRKFQSRPASCYLRGNASRTWIEHGESITQSLQQGASVSCVRQRCMDGALRETGTCTLKRVTFECHATAGQPGCEAVATCPTGTTPITAMAACDLQDGAISKAELLALLPGELVVYRGDAPGSDSFCQVGKTREFQRRQIIRFESLKHGATAIPIHCMSSGDAKGCQIRGVLFCTSDGE